MQKPKISVITPVYNTADYLVQCLDSLESQTLQDIEFICIDDGSTDASPSILAEYEMRDKRFRVITQQNAGYGKTMNRGLQEARGEYIGILESDDYAKPHMFETLYTLAQENNADVCKANYQVFKTGEAPTYKNNIPAKFINTTITPCENDNLSILQIAPSIWSAIYKKGMLLANDIWFTETPGAAFQDTGFTLKALLAAQRMHMTDDAFVFYRTDRDESSSNSLSITFAVCNEYAEVRNWLHRHKKDSRTTLANLEVCKFNTYLWNLRRLHPSLRTAFFWRCHEELNSDYAEGIVDKELFTPNRQWHLDRVLNKPDEYLSYMQQHYKQDDEAGNTTTVKLDTIHELVTQYGIAEQQVVKQSKAVHEAQAEIDSLTGENKVLAQEQQALQETISTLEQKLSAHEKTIASYKEKVVKVRQSRSYRLGHALLAPLRFCKKLLRK